MNRMYLVGLCRIHDGPFGLRFYAHRASDPTAYISGSIGGYRRALEAAATAMCMPVAEYRRAVRSYRRSHANVSIIDAADIGRILHDTSRSNTKSGAVVYHIYPGGLLTLSSGEEI